MIRGNILIKLTSDDSVAATIPVTDAQVTGTGTFRDAANNDYAGITDKTTWNFTTENLYIPPPTQQTTPEPTVSEGTLTNVTLAEGAKIEGGTVEGTINGNPEAPAILINVKITPC